MDFGRFLCNDYCNSIRCRDGKIMRRTTQIVCLIAAAFLGGCAGRGVLPTDPATLQKLAEGGNPLAANNLGVLYANGKQVPQDFAQAKKWYMFASEHGDPAGAFNLGFAYEHGQGTAV